MSRGNGASGAQRLKHSTWDTALASKEKAKFPLDKIKIMWYNIDENGKRQSN